ncbi:hypothetical protein BpHYR1_024719, partial [Brachionus plicatilis]
VRQVIQDEVNSQLKDSLFETVESDTTSSLTAHPVIGTHWMLIQGE